MLKTLFLSLLALSAVVARENPFTDAFDPNSLPVTNNTVKVFKPLKNESISLPSTARTVSKITVEYVNLDGSVVDKVLKVDKSIDWHVPISISHHKKSEVRKKFTKTKGTSFIRFEQKSKTIRLITKNSLLRHFMITKPYRIVMDFSRMSNFLSKKFELNSGGFKIVRIGNHKNYYRVVLELDGQYEYKLSKRANGVEIDIK